MARRSTSWSPLPSSASLPVGRGSGTPGPLRSVTSMRMALFAVLIAIVTVSPGAPEPLCRRLLTKSSSTTGRQRPHRGHRDLAPRTRTRGRGVPAPPVPQASRSREPPAQPSPHPPSRPPAPLRDHAGDRADTGDARSTRERASSRNGHRNPVKRLPTPLPGQNSRPLCVRGPRNATVYSATR